MGIDVDKRTHYAAVVDANDMAYLPKPLTFANTRTGYMQVQAAIAEATAHALPSEVIIGCEAMGPYWLSLYEALSHMANKLIRMIYSELKGQWVYVPGYSVGNHCSFELNCNIRVLRFEG